MSGDGSSPGELDRLAEEFVARTRKGEAPTISSYARANPDLAGEIRDLFPCLLDLEGGRVDDAEPPRELGDYVLLREIGRGGMGVVYEAIQKTLGRRVALKVLPPQMTLDPRFLERFRLEAQAAARLQHPRIVPVIGWGEDQGVYYFTMQYIDGCGLDDVIAHVAAIGEASPSAGEADEVGRILADRMLAGTEGDGRDGTAPTASSRERPVVGRTYFDNAARLVLQTAEGIAAAHARGVLHRDVKPSNLLLDEKGAVWISDFGLCKEAESEGLTQPGDLLGTFRYMAPERFEGISDVQGDVYGLGVTLYELLARRPAYGGDDRAAIAAQIVNSAPVRPRRVDPRIPRDLELIVLKAIARDRSSRYATADALAADLRAYLERRPIAARPPTMGYLLRSAVRRHRAITLIAGVALLVLLGSTAYYVGSLREKESVARFRQYVAMIAAAESALRDQDVAVARRLLEEAPVELRNWEWHHLRSRLDRSLRSFPSWQEPVQDVCHSPDGRLLAASSRNETRVHDEATAEQVGSLRHRGDVYAIDWHPDGTALAVSTRAGLEVWTWPDAARILDLPLGTVRDVRYAPDGSRLLAGGHDGLLRVWDTATWEELLAQSLHSQIYSVAFDASGSRIAAGTWDAHVAVFDREGGRPLWRRKCGRSGVQSLCFVGDDLVAAPSSDGHVELRRASDGELMRVLGHEKRPMGVAAPPDGRSLVVWDAQRIHIWAPQSGKLLVTYGVDGEPWCGSCHPTGDRVVTGSERGTVHEWLMPRVRDPDLCVGEFGSLMALDFAPSGTRFITGGASRVIRVWDAATHEEVRNWLGHLGVINCLRFSPDEEWVASGDFAGEVLLWRVEADALVHRLPAIAEGDYARGPWASGVAFSADSERLFTGGEDGALCVWDVHTGERLARLPITEGMIETLTTSNDGRWLGVGDSEGVIRLLSTADYTVDRVLTGHTGHVLSLAFGPGDELLASASWDRTVRLWDVARGDALHTLRSITSDSAGRADAFAAVSFHPDGSRVVASSVDCSARLWDTASGRLVATLRGERDWMEGARFSPDATRLVTVEGRGIIRIWETRPLRDRLAALTPDASAAAAARAAVTAARETSDDAASVIESLRARSDLDADAREMALRDAYRARGSEEALLEWLWRTFLPPDAAPEEREIAVSIAHALVQRARHESIQDARRNTLAALGVYRSGHYRSAVAWKRLTAMLNEGGAPDLHALDLAVLCMAHARLEEREAAAEWMAKLEALLAEHPEVRRARGVESLLAEARALLE